MCCVWLRKINMKEYIVNTHNASGTARRLLNGRSIYKRKKDTILPKMDPGEKIIKTVM